MYTYGLKKKENATRTFSKRRRKDWRRNNIHLTLIDWDRGKQYVLWTRDCRCCPRRSQGKLRQSRVYKKYCFSEVSVSKYFIYQDSKKRKDKRTSYENTGNIIIIFQKKPVKFNSAHNVMHKTFAVFGCPKVACSRDGAHNSFFVIYRWILHYLSRALMRGRQSNFVNLTWYALHQWNTWKGELWRLVYNKTLYFFSIFNNKERNKNQRLKWTPITARRV